MNYDVTESVHVENLSQVLASTWGLTDEIKL